MNHRRNFIENLPLREILLPQLLLDVGTERHQTLVLLAMLRMITTKRDELLANWTSAVRFPLAVLGVRHNALHLLTRRQSTVCVATLTRVHQRLYASLNRLLPGFLRVRLRSSIGGRRAVVEIKAKTFHLMLMADFLFAWKAEVEILLKGKMKVSWGKVLMENCR